MTVYRIHVSLMDIEPPIWRRIELSSQSTLDQLHRVIQIAMGWQDYHPHEFEIDDERYGVPDPDLNEPDVISDRTVCVSEVLRAPGAEMRYLYDFGDDWVHTVRLEAVVEEEPGAIYPRVLDGARSGPPEDCGGPFGYADLLEALIDPKHERFKEMREWAGLKFNAEVFSAQKVNARLRRNRSLAARK